MRRAFALLLSTSAAACDAPARPWESRYDAGTPKPAGSTWVPPPDASLLGDAGSLLLVGTEDAGPPPSPVRIGGTWVKCYGGFRPSGEPVRDVTRLSLMCGPENGMTQLSNEPIVGTVGAGNAPVRHPFEGVRGECYRVFAVAEPSVPDLDVVVRSRNEATIAADHGEDGWPIVQPDRPFCVLEDETFTVEVSAKSGQGRFAAAIWRLLPIDARELRRY